MSMRRSRPKSIAAIACLAAGLSASATSASPDFFKAVRQDDHARVEAFLAKGVASNVLNGSLFHALSEGMARTLLAGGADPDASVHEYGNALHTAAHDGMTGVVRALIDAGADVHATTPTPRHTALSLAAHPSNARRSTLEIARMLIDAGADVNSRTYYGATPLHMAARHGGEPAMIDLLLDNGADPLARLTHSRRGDTGKTPLDYARKYNPRLLRSDAGRRLESATRRAGMDGPGCDGVVVQPSDTKLSWLAERTLGRASRWREIVELNGLEGRGYRAGDCLKLP